MNKVFDIGKFDLDVTLRDAALDRKRENTPTFSPAMKRL